MKKLLILALLVVAPAWATDNCANLPAPTTLAWNELESTPRMGYSTWYDQFTSPTAAHVEAMSGDLVSDGYQAAGYKWVDIDDGWASGRTSGTITPNATNFPSGMAAVATYVHGNGQFFGIYSSPDTTTCDGVTGSGTFEAADAATFASWGADYLKYDGCSVNTLYTSCWSTSYQQVWQMMAQAIRGTGRNIIMNLGTNPAVVGSGVRAGDDMNTDIQWAGNVGYNEVYFQTYNLWGFGGTGWATLTGIYLPVARGLFKYEKPGYFPDCDFLTGPTLNSEFGTTFFTQTQSQTQMGLYALWGCPLIISEDLTTIPSPLQAIYQNAGVIAVDQEPLAHAAILYQQMTCGSSVCQVWVKPLSGNKWAFGFLNLDSASHTIAVSFKNFGGNPDVYDLWASSDLGTMTSYSVSVASDAIAMIKVTPAAGAAHTITNMQLENMAIQ